VGLVEAPWAELGAPGTLAGGCVASLDSALASELIEVIVRVTGEPVMLFRGSTWLAGSLAENAGAETKLLAIEDGCEGDEDGDVPEEAIVNRGE